MPTPSPQARPSCSTPARPCPACACWPSTRRSWAGPKERQTLLFSATVPPDIERMAKKLHTPEFLTLSGDHIGALEIEHFVYMVATDKLAALVRVLEVENPESAVIF